MKLYLAGPMRGHPLFNFAAFFSAALHLKELGHDIINPAERDMAEGLDPSNPDIAAQGIDIHSMFDFDFRAIQDSAGIVFLPGWEDSKGACAERVVGHYLGKLMFDYSPDEREGLKPQRVFEAPEILWRVKPRLHS